MFELLQCDSHNGNDQLHYSFCVNRIDKVDAKQYVECTKYRLHYDETAFSVGKTVYLIMIMMYGTLV